MTRYLCIDYGTKRIGLAVGDDQMRLASPLETLGGTGHAKRDAKAVLQRGRDFEVDAFVLGLPAHMDGHEGEQANITRAFGGALTRISGLPVHYWDERLSSYGADELLKEQAGTKKQMRGRQDALAAHIVLQEFLDAEVDEEPGIAR